MSPTLSGGNQGTGKSSAFPRVKKQVRGGAGIGTCSLFSPGSGLNDEAMDLVFQWASNVRIFPSETNGFMDLSVIISPI